MTLQTELNFIARDPVAAQLDARLHDLILALDDGAWHTAKQLRESGFRDRELRAVVEHDEAAEILSFPGSPGYKLFRHASEAEIERIEALRTQAKAMAKRYIRYARRKATLHP
jgi:hypothetical protein